MAHELQRKTERLPTAHLPQTSRIALTHALVGTMAIDRARSLPNLPRTEIVSAIRAEATKLGKVISREECDGYLRDLALMLPRANIARDDIPRMLDLYHGLLSKNGVTEAMMRTACEEIIMAPPGKGGKFFPDPGEIFARCRDAAINRKKSLDGFRKAMAIVNGEEEGQGDQPVRDARTMLKELGNKLRANGRTT